MLDFSIRKATINDIDNVVGLHMASFRPEDHVPVSLGERYVRASYYWLVTSDYSYLLLAESEGKLAGLIAVSDGSFTRPMFKACLSEFVLSIVRRPTILANGQLWERLFRRPESSEIATIIANYPGVAQMTIVAVSKEFRGHGIFPALIESTKIYSSARESRAIRAGVYKSNHSIQRAFEKAGWAEAADLESEETKFYIAYLDADIENELYGNN